MDVKEEVNDGDDDRVRVRVVVAEGVRVGVPSKIAPVTVNVEVGEYVLVKVVDGVRVAVPVKVDEAVGVGG